MSLIQKLEDAATERSLGKATVQCYSFWVRKLYGYCRKRGSDWAGADVRTWMLHLAAQNYSAVSRKQALNAVVFVFKHVLQRDLGHLDLPPMPKVRQTLRTIPSREELGRIFSGMTGQAKLMGLIMYGSGLRVGCECCRLRVKDVDFAGPALEVWEGKGLKCRRTVLPVSLVPALRRHIAWVKSVHDLDLANGGGLVELPARLAQKYKNANREFGWQWLFPSAVVRGQYRWHATDEMIGKQMRQALRAAGIVKRITPHTLRHAFATHAMQVGNDPRTVQDLLGHESLLTTMIYLHGDAPHGTSPLDALARPVVNIGGLLT
jgi:integron integrase